MTEPSAPACPLRTAPGEPATREIRAYKLGKKRWSYNQVELKLGEASGTREVKIKQATLSSDAAFPAPAQDSAACFHVQLEGGQRLQAHFYVVYDGEPPAAVAAVAADAGRQRSDRGAEPPSGSSRRKGAPTLAPAGDDAPTQPAPQPQPQPSGSASAPKEDAVKAEPAAEAGAEAASSSASTTADDGLTSWSLVLRKHCCKGCQGCMLRTVKRFGRLGKRSWSDDPEEQDIPTVVSNPHEMKDPRWIYLAIDEACTHVGAAAFRLVAGVYDSSGERLLATSVSPPIRVLANNDVPTGAARIPINVQLPADWEGWNATPEPESEAAPAAAKRARRPRARKPAAARTSPDPASGSAASQGSSQGRVAAAHLPAAQHAMAAQHVQQQRQHSLPVGALDPAHSLGAGRAALSLPLPGSGSAAHWRPAAPAPQGTGVSMPGYSFSVPAPACAPHPPLSVWQAAPQPTSAPFAAHGSLPPPQPASLPADPSCQPAWTAAAQQQQQQQRQHSLPQYTSSMLSGSTAVPADSGAWQHQQQALSAATSAHHHHHHQLLQQQQRQQQQLAASAGAAHQQRPLAGSMVPQVPQPVVPQPGGWLNAAPKAQFSLAPPPAELAPLAGPDLASIFDDLLGPAQLPAY